MSEIEIKKEPYLIKEIKKGTIFAGRNENDIILPLDKFNELVKSYEQLKQKVKELKSKNSKLKKELEKYKDYFYKIIPSARKKDELTRLKD